MRPREHEHEHAPPCAAPPWHSCADRACRDRGGGEGEGGRRTSPMTPGWEMGGPPLHGIIAQGEERVKGKEKGKGKNDVR